MFITEILEKKELTKIEKFNMIMRIIFYILSFKGRPPYPQDFEENINDYDSDNNIEMVVDFEDCWADPFYEHKKK